MHPRVITFEQDTSLRYLSIRGGDGGWPTQALTGGLETDWLPEDAPLLTLKRRVLASGEPERATLTVATRPEHGRARWRVDVALTPTLDGGVVVGLEGTSIDLGLVTSAAAFGAASLIAGTTARTELTAVADLGGRLLRAGAEWVDLTGWTLDELLDGFPNQLFHPDDIAGVGGAFDELAAGARSRVTFPARVRSKNGRWLELAWDAHADAAGEQTFLVARATTARRAQASCGQAQRDRDEATTRLRELARTLPGALLQLRWPPGADLRDPATPASLVYLGDGARRRFGVDPERAARRTWRLAMLVDEGHLATAHESLACAAEGDGDWQVRFSAVMPNGRFMTVQLLATMAQATDGATEATGLMLDVTESERVAERLMAPQAGAGVGVWELDARTRELFWTAETFRIHDLDPNGPTPALREAIGFYAPECVPTITRLVERAMDQGEPWEAELELITATGRRVWTRSHGLPLRRGGRVVRVVGSFQDISDEKRHVVELERTREEALEASRIKSQFLANMSHEIRTPMNGVMGMADLTLDTELDAEQRTYLQTLRHSADHLLAIIDDILDLSKIEANRIVLEQRAFDLHEVLGHTVKLLAPEAFEKDLTLVVDIALEVPRDVVGDEARLRQILTNLVGNAVKFTSTGRVVVEVESDPHGKGPTPRGKGPQKRGVCVRVRDTGPGIPPDSLDGVFQPFTQADGSMTRKFGGTGLGLTISRQLARLMGGDLYVAETSEAGTVFELTLQFATPEATPWRRQTDRVGPGRRPWRLGGRAGVIVSDPAERQAISRNVFAIGLRAEHATPTGPVDADKPLTPVDVVIWGDEFGEPVDEAGRWRGPRAWSGTPCTLVSRLDRRRADGIPVLARPVVRDALRAVLVEAIQAGPLTPATRSGRRVRRPTRPITRDLRGECRALRILVAEDNRVNAMVVERLLEKRGHEVTVVGDGQATVEAWREAAWDLVLMDVQMPVMDGLEATRRIREEEQSQPGRATTPIVALTANAMKGDDEMCFAAGMDAYLTKPLDTAALDRTLQQVARGEA